MKTWHKTVIEVLVVGYIFHTIAVNALWCGTALLTGEALMYTIFKRLVDQDEGAVWVAVVPRIQYLNHHVLLYSGVAVSIDRTTREQSLGRVERDIFRVAGHHVLCIIPE